MRNFWKIINKIKINSDYCFKLKNQENDIYFK